MLTSWAVLTRGGWRVSARQGRVGEKDARVVEAIRATSGFKPRLGTYNGTEIPIPLEIDIQHGEHNVEQVAQDILALTKLNYNTYRLGEGEPVTIGYSDAVGEILISNPNALKRSPNFKFYIERMHGTKNVPSGLVVSSEED
jgi:hypothetical protein